LVVGRRESCDIVLRFSNVSAYHCELILEGGYWYVRDKGSRNGTKVNGVRISARKRLDPGDELSVAKHKYDVAYVPTDCGAVGPPPPEEANEFADIMGKSLLHRAGLHRRTESIKTPTRRYDATNDEAGQIKPKSPDSK
jgi:adenylate cyclase